MKKPRFPCELAYVLGIVTLGFGVAFMEKADFGVSMVIAPAYVLYRAISPHLPFFTFGMAEYCFQALLLIALFALLRRFRLSFLFSFVTAVIYGLLLDVFMALIRPLSFDSFAVRIVGFIAGMLLSSLGVSLEFHTYIAPSVYELFVKEISAKYGKDIHKVKTVYDICSCTVAVILSFCFFGFGVFRGVKLGTILCALINGSLIGLCSKLLEHFFVFKNRFKPRGFF